MGMSADTAKQLQPGDKLRFGNERRYFEVISVKDVGVNKVYLELRREDGLDTFATENDLDVAEMHVLPAEQPPVEPPELKKKNEEPPEETDGQGDKAEQVMQGEGDPNETAQEAQDRLERDEKGRFKKAGG